MSTRNEERTVKVQDTIQVCDLCGGDISVLQMWSDLSPKGKDSHATCVAKVLTVLYSEPTILSAVRKKINKLDRE